MTKKKSSLGKLSAALVGAVAATAAGAVYLYGKNGSKHRKQVESWMLKARAEVMEKIEKAKQVGKADYEKMVGDVMDKYAKVKTIKNTDVKMLAKDLKAHWHEIMKEANIAGKNVKMAVKSARKKIVSQRKTG